MTVRYRNLDTFSDLESKMNIVQRLVDAFTVDIVNWWIAMDELRVSVKVWAMLFPLQQMIWGSWSLVFVGPKSIGAAYMYVRLESAIVAGQMNRQRRGWKLMGPFMHALYYFLVPYSILWLATDGRTNDQALSPMVNSMHYYFVLYTTVITTISLVADTRTFMLWWSGEDVGVYKKRKRY